MGLGGTYDFRASAYAWIGVCMVRDEMHRCLAQIRQPRKRRFLLSRSFQIWLQSHVDQE